MQEVEPKFSSGKISSSGPITAERFILFLDIMGFKDRVARNSHDSVLADLTKLQTAISNLITVYKNAEVQYNLFSDSILLFSRDDTCASLKALSQIAIKIMNEAIGAGIPLKGALAKGRVTCDITKQLFFGQALIDAYLLQENTKYYGVVVHHSAEENVKKFAEGLFSDAQVCLKSGEVSHFQLNWFLDKNGQVKPAVNGNLKKLRNSVSDAPRKYIDNTNKIITELSRQRGSR